MAGPRIALIHATPVSIEPARAAFAELWPEARTTNLLDDSLSADLAAVGGTLDAAMIERFRVLARYVTTSGADAILFTCSAFGRAIEAVQKENRIPVLKPNEAAFDAALAAGSSIAIVVTFGPSLPALRTEIEESATAQGRTLQPTLVEVPGAMAALAQGRADEHDAAIAEAVAGLGAHDAVILGQFSMSRAAQRAAQRTKSRVITTPGAAVQRLKSVMTR
jgi:Asp/Glu/hydantoin racemase